MLEVYYRYFSHKMKGNSLRRKKFDGKFPSGREVQEGKLNR